MVDIRVSAKEGYDVAKEGNNFVILNTNLTQDLINEGVARELISKVQNLRKLRNFDVSDRIILSYEAACDFDKVINELEEMIKEETLSVKIVKTTGLKESFDLNGIEVKLDVEKA